MTTPRPVVLCILDGWGLSEQREGNAPLLADTPNFDRIWANCPHATLVTHGPDVGLPRGQMGNSEVGHMNIGAGRVVALGLGRIDLAIEDGSFFANPALRSFIDKLKASGGTAQVIGLASPGGVHSHQAHMLAAVRAMTEAGIPVQIHAITDGRDVPPQSAAEQLAEIMAELPEGARIGTVIGRYYAMDRDRRWERVAEAAALVLRGEGRAAPDPVSAVKAAYDAGETDEFIRATRIEGYQPPRDGDGLFFVNFRADRAREILSALVDPEFDAFDPGPRPRWAALCGMASYGERLDELMEVMFPPVVVKNTLAHWIALKGRTQFHIAETEKYPHVTYFFNGGVEEPEPGEDRFMAPSPKVPTYDLKPEMSAPEVTEHLVDAIRKPYDFIVVNYANPDMVGHTGSLEAAIKACEAVDRGLGAALRAVEEMGGAIIVTADHGNCEMMIDPETGGPHTAHTMNPVPVILVGGPKGASLASGRLADLAPTVLELMGLDQPAEMTGQSLIRR
ncbi:MAG: 2,3-bisphosphoglycerate-independent phosphoglycerate mutase [Alphaproteobacteria bacterium]|nr:MAG: 2,3-bisphosphoglycerate-independent phosphoglycerate mutase [Alphaproteobacteria bacterium]